MDVIQQCASWMWKQSVCVEVFLAPQLSHVEPGQQEFLGIMGEGDEQFRTSSIKGLELGNVWWFDYASANSDWYCCGFLVVFCFVFFFATVNEDG